MKNAVIWDNITESENGGQKVDKFYEASGILKAIYASGDKI